MGNNTGAESAAVTSQEPEKEMEPQPATGTVFVTVKNLEDGARDYPLTNGSSLYLPMKHKGAAWPKIPVSQVSPALRTAERKGRVQIIREQRGE
ncbi:MAG: hypothetical protein LBC93_06885 [Synergistaceae bacterium]|nr:hypothetical protein [Synergistaceae bacterium]